MGAIGRELFVARGEAETDVRGGTMGVRARAEMDDGGVVGRNNNYHGSRERELEIALRMNMCYAILPNTDHLLLRLVGCRGEPRKVCLFHRGNKQPACSQGI